DEELAANRVHRTLLTSIPGRPTSSNVVSWAHDRSEQMLDPAGRTRHNTMMPLALFPEAARGEAVPHSSQSVRPLRQSRAASETPGVSDTVRSVGGW
ncbi:MAG: hypothetical protein LC775_13695, partial [Acidobacteria bacterium]|nr:hypothetical protein [Acidobacteriota bacterium]